MPSPLLPISTPPSSVAGPLAMQLKPEIGDDPYVSFHISFSFKEESTVPMKPLLSRTMSFNCPVSNQQRRRRVASESSLPLLFAESGRRHSFSGEVGHAAAETFLVTGLSLKLLRYLGYCFCLFGVVTGLMFVFHVGLYV